MSRSTRHYAALVCVLASLILRASIPSGYMPAKPGSGLLFELCPSSVPAELMVAISGAGNHHHHGADSQQTHFDAEQCPIGQLLSAAVAVDDKWLADGAPAATPFAAGVVSVLESRTPAHRRSRDPPA